MSLVVTSQSKVLMLELILNKTSAPGSRKLKLFTNNIVPALSTTISQLTECTLAGYTEKVLSGAGWTVSTIDGITSASYEEQVFNIEEEALIYGYFVTDANGTQLLWAERFTGAPYFLPSGGGSIGIELNLVLN